MAQWKTRALRADVYLRQTTPPQASPLAMSAHSGYGPTHSDSDRVDVSIVSPVYRAERLVKKLVQELGSVFGSLGLSYEIILVEDSSPDGSWDVIKEVCADFSGVRAIKLSRNFGQHYAISAGLTRARGHRVIVMDCDLQDRPSEIPKLLAKAEEGFDVVLARRAIRRDGLFKRASSRLFYGLLDWLTGVKQDPAIANFGVYSDKVIAAINSMPETIRYFPTMVRWVGFRAATVDVEHSGRAEGESSYNLRKLLNLALDICLAYSDKPLRIVVGTGFVVSLTGFAFATYTAVLAVEGKIAVLGYASLIVSLWILSGLIIVIVGVVGLYVGKAFEGIKGRPAFIVAEEISEPDPQA
jgi:dolichol-phosphate mannosyltransferase